MGFPAWYDIEIRSTPGACLKHLEAMRSRILDFKPELIILDICGNDLSQYEVTAGEASAQILVFLLSLLDDLLACLMTRVVLIEQHFRNRIPGSFVHYSLLNHCIRDWHNVICAIEGIDHRISSQRLLGLNGVD